MVVGRAEAVGRAVDDAAELGSRPHDDEEREFSYIAGAEESLRRASSEGWTVASMKNDWKTVFPL